MKADFSYRNNQTIVRYLDYDNNQLAGGQNIWSLKLTADYAFSKNLTAIFYYDHPFKSSNIYLVLLQIFGPDLRFDIILGIKFIKI
jgi:cell surface protein SprA